MALHTRLLIVSSAVSLGGLASLTALWNLGQPVSITGLSEGVTNAPSRVMREAAGTVRASPGAAVPVELAARVRNAARLDPLQAETFLIAALDQAPGGADGKRLELLEEARRRNPRSNEVRIFLIDEYLRRGDGGAAAIEISVLQRLLPQAQQVLLPMLGQLVADPATRSQVISALSGPLRKPLLQDLARGNASPYLLIAMTPDLAGKAMDEQERGWIADLSQPYVERGDLAAARMLWTHFNGMDAPAGEVVDPSFEGRAGPPFGWVLTTTGGGIAEARDGRLEVSHYGRSGWVVARQLLQLRPGTYRLAFDRSKKSGPLPNLAWRIDCLGSGTSLLDYPLTPSGPFVSATPDKFTVPAQGCPGQWLALTARPDEAPGTRTIAIGNVRVLPEGTQ